MSYFRINYSMGGGGSITRVKTGNTGYITLSSTGSNAQAVNQNLGANTYSAAILAITQVNAIATWDTCEGTITNIGAKVLSQSFDPSTGKFSGKIDLYCQDYPNAVHTRKVIAYWAIYAI